MCYKNFQSIWERQLYLEFYRCSDLFTVSIWNTDCSVSAVAKLIVENSTNLYESWNLYGSPKCANAFLIESLCEVDPTYLLLYSLKYLNALHVPKMYTSEYSMLACSPRSLIKMFLLHLEQYVELLKPSAGSAMVSNHCLFLCIEIDGVMHREPWYIYWIPPCSNQYLDLRASLRSPPDCRAH